jgi:hypothetical protein
MKKLFTLLAIFTLIGCSPSELDKCIDSNSYTNPAYEDYRVGEYIEAWVYLKIDMEKLLYLPFEEYEKSYDDAMYSRNNAAVIELEDVVFGGFYNEDSLGEYSALLAAESSESTEFKYAQYDIEEASLDDTIAAAYKNYSTADWTALEMKFINELKTIAKKYNDKDNISKESAEKICNRQGIY